MTDEEMKKMKETKKMNDEKPMEMSGHAAGGCVAEEWERSPRNASPP